MGANFSMRAPYGWTRLGDVARALASRALRRRMGEKAGAAAPTVRSREDLRTGGEASTKLNEVPGCFPAAGRAAAMLDGSATMNNTAAEQEGGCKSAVTEPPQQ